MTTYNAVVAQATKVFTDWAVRLDKQLLTWMRTMFASTPSDMRGVADHFLGLHTVDSEAMPGYDAYTQILADILSVAAYPYKLKLGPNPGSYQSTVDTAQARLLYTMALLSVMAVERAPDNEESRQRVVAVLLGTDRSLDRVKDQTIRDAAYNMRLAGYDACLHSARASDTATFNSYRAASSLYVVAFDVIIALDKLPKDKLEVLLHTDLMADATRNYRMANL